MTVPMQKVVPRDEATSGGDRLRNEDIPEGKSNNIQ